MIRTKLAAILSAGFLLTMAGPMALGFVPGAQYWLDAGDNPAHPDGWANLGTAGGVMPSGEKGAPVLEPNAGPDGGPAYTVKESGQCFGRDAWGILHRDTAVSLIFENWTVEVWLQRHGKAFGGGEHQFLCFMDTPWAPRQGIIFRFDDLNEGPDTGKVRILIIGLKGDGEHIFPEVDIGLEEWHQIAFTYDNGTSLLQSYMDGKPVGDPIELIQDFSTDVEMKNNAVFRSDPGDEDNRVFNGSINLVRLYDRPLSDAEILENFRNPRAVAVEPASNFSTTWGNVKARY